MAKLWSNNFSTTTTGAIGSGDLFIDLASIVGLPLIGSGNYVHLTLVDSLSAPTQTEIVRATGVSVNTIEVVRAQENTTAQIWGSGSFIELRATADAFNRLDGTEITLYEELVELAATQDIDRNNGGIQIVTLSAPQTVTLSNLTSGRSMVVHFINGSTNAITWPVGLKWVTGAEPAMTDDCAVSFWNVNGTTYASFVGGF